MPGPRPTLRAKGGVAGTKATLGLCFLQENSSYRRAPEARGRSLWNSFPVTPPGVEGAREGPNVSTTSQLPAPGSRRDCSAHQNPEVRQAQEHRPLGHLSYFLFVYLSSCVQLKKELLSHLERTLSSCCFMCSQENLSETVRLKMFLSFPP